MRSIRPTLCGLVLNPEPAILRLSVWMMLYELFGLGIANAQEPTLVCVREFRRALSAKRDPLGRLALRD
jgi:hypothetical protein